MPPPNRYYKRIRTREKLLSQNLLRTKEESFGSALPLHILKEIGMGLHAVAAVFLLSYLCLPEITGTVSSSKTRLRDFEMRHQIGGLPLTNRLIIHAKWGIITKRKQEKFDDYGHLRFGKRGEKSEDYGVMRFGKRHRNLNL